MSKESKAKIPKYPMRRIALTCSGGGYRAASFHLGAMAFLDFLHYDDKPLLENVKALSTVSGGTITGLIYAQQLEQNKSFAKIYHFILEKLRDLDLVRLGLTKLSPQGAWSNSFKRKNLINAFAEIYDEHFTKGETFKIFPKKLNSHLEDVMFNATEFTNGVIFRFQNRARFGNFYFPVSNAIAKEVKLADIIASSSCFTGGFEPMEWPGDFRHEKSESLCKKLQDLDSTALMDGGIYDNQGIDSILRAEQRANTEPYDLIIVTDVTSPYMKRFDFDAAGPDRYILGQVNFHLLRQKIRSYRRWISAALAFVILLAVILLLITGVQDSILTGVLISVVVVAAAIFAIGFLIKNRIDVKIGQGRKYLIDKLSGQIPVEELGNLDATRISYSALETLLLDRIKSLTTLIGDVWLKVVRRLVYNRLYYDDRHEFRRVSNLIRELTRHDYEFKEILARRNDRIYYQDLEGCDPVLKGSYSRVISKKIETLAEDAAGFGTNLWFTDQDKIEKRLDHLVMAGQISMCFNLLIYLTEIQFTPDNGFAELASEVKINIISTYDQCLAAWKRFQDEPDFLLRKLAKANESS